MNLTKRETIEISDKLSVCRHNVNNKLALMVAAVEVIRRQPERTDKLIDTILNQTRHVLIEIDEFSESFASFLDVED